MKNYFTLISLCFAGLMVVIINSCKKDSPAIEYTLTEEFADMYNISSHGWVCIDNSVSNTGDSANWTQGFTGQDKSGNQTGFPAHSYKFNVDEYAYSAITGYDADAIISSWLISPVLSVKNGDQIFFFTRGDQGNYLTDRMQVLLNPTGTTDVGSDPKSTGDFTITLDDINKSEVPGGYPPDWRRYSYTISGFPEKTSVRIGFHHFTANSTTAHGIGVDLFQFLSK